MRYRIERDSGLAIAEVDDLEIAKRMAKSMMPIMDIQLYDTHIARYVSFEGRLE